MRMIKKLLLSLVLLVFAGYMSAQTLVFTQDGEPISPGTYYVIGDIDEMGELKFEMDVTNNGNEAVDIICEKVEISTVDNTLNYFCWGQCMGPNVFISQPVNMEPGIPTLFSAHFMPNATGDEIHMEYHFYQEGGEHFVFDVTFKYSLESVVDLNDTDVFSNAYPNPASNIVSFDYDLPSNVENAQVTIYNMMGQEVIRQDINGNAGKLDINISDLSEGVYFYSLIINNKTQRTNKLVIKK